MKPKYCSIGTIFLYKRDNVLLRVKEGSNIECEGCYFKEKADKNNEKCDCCFPSVFNYDCLREYRKDNKNVVFEKIGILTKK